MDFSNLITPNLEAITKLYGKIAASTGHLHSAATGDGRSSALIIGTATFNVERGALTDRTGKDIPLRPQSTEVLRALATRAGAVVEKDTLMAEVWGDVAVTDDSLTQCIADIRRALGDRDHKIVHTTPKKGYRLLAEAASAPRRRPWAVAPGIAAFLAAVLLGVWHFSAKPVDDSLLVEKLVAPDVTRSEPSIAVLPFESVEGDERWTRLGRGLAAEIASGLALNDWLYVTVPESLMNVAFGELPAGHMLDVGFVLSGAIQAQGEEIRISAHLTDAATREILWSETWTEPKHDIFTVQDRIVARIGSSLASTYSGVVAQAGLKRAKRKLTSDLNAYEHYLIGFELLHRFDPANQPEAIEHLETALEIDPSFAGALVTLSVLQFIQGDHTEGDAARRWLEASQESAYRAYAIDPNNPNVLWNVARAYALDGQVDIAGKTLRRAVAIAPNNADVLMISAGYSGIAGIFGPEPLAWARRALELNPLAPAWWHSSLGEAALGAGEFDLAIDTMKRAPARDPVSWLVTALVEAHLGNFAEARNAARRFRELAPNLTIEGYVGGTESDRPDHYRTFDAARLLGLPITDADLELANMGPPSTLPANGTSGDER